MLHLTVDTADIRFALKEIIRGGAPPLQIIVQKQCIGLLTDIAIFTINQNGEVLPSTRLTLTPESIRPERKGSKSPADRNDIQDHSGSSRRCVGDDRNKFLAGSKNSS